MKKIILLFSIAFMFSCSNDNETNVKESSNVENNSSATTTSSTSSLPPIEDANDQMFYDYVTSDIYLEIVNNIRQFRTLANFPENIDFETTTQMFLWIETNIDLTSFVSIEDAHNQWDDIIDLQQLERSQFSNIYEFMLTEDEVLVVSLLDKWITPSLVDLPATTTATCSDKFDKCANSANLEYFNKSNSQSDNAEHMAAIKDKQMKALEKCTKDYADCIEKK